jgi:hypothetical protein
MSSLDSRSDPGSRRVLGPKGRRNEDRAAAHPDFPHVDASPAPLSAGLTELQLEEVVEDEGCAYLSLTILVNCVDVIGSPTVMKAAGRVDVQTDKVC